jgi:hypothetical protein
VRDAQHHPGVVGEEAPVRHDTHPTTLILEMYC